MNLPRRLRVYYLTAIFGVVFAVVGFSYNAWRLEVSEDNNNIRTAAFEVLILLAELEQLIYAAHYDKDLDEGNPRKGWIKVGLIVDLSNLISSDSMGQAEELKIAWSNNWRSIANNRTVTNFLVQEIDSVRGEIKFTLKQLD